VGAPIRVGSGPVAIAAGGGGVWVALASGSVVRIDPRTMRRVGASIPVVDPGGIAVDGDRVWVTSRAQDELLRIDARSGRTTGPAIPVGAKPTDVAAGLGGVWVANSADGTVTHVDPDTGRADEPIHVARHRALNPGNGGRPVEQPGGAEVLGLTVGEGAVWVAKTDSVQTTTIQVRRIDPRTRRVTGDPIAVDGGIPMHLAAGGGGVWVTDVGSLPPGAPPRRPALQRIDPGTRRVSGDPIPLGRQPAGLAVGPTGVWVAEAGENSVDQIGAGGGRG
ncbi:MAG: Vgb family protein, partial [Solirubrobacteraceae bacterium]